jgi:hypothetical protein
MAVPSGYDYKDGAYWKAEDGSGPYAITAGGVAVLMSPYAYVGVLASRPAANSLPAGTEIVLTDIGIGGYSHWKTDGTDWLPTCEIVMFRETAAAATGLSTVTGDATNNKPFTPPVYGSCGIPAGLLNTKMRIAIEAVAVRGGVASTTSNFLVRLGNTAFDTVNGGQIAQVLMPATINISGRLEGIASFSSVTSAVITRVMAINGTNATGATDLAISDLASNITYITLAMSSPLAVGETVALIRYEVKIS